MLAKLHKNKVCRLCRLYVEYFKSAGRLVEKPYPIVEDDANVVLVKLVVHVCRPAAIRTTHDHEMMHIAAYAAVVAFNLQ